MLGVYHGPLKKKKKTSHLCWTPFPVLATKAEWTYLALLKFTTGSKNLSDNLVTDLSFVGVGPHMDSFVAAFHYSREPQRRESGDVCH